MKAHRSGIDLPFIETFLRTMLGLLFEQQRHGEQHGDLHAGNVLVAKSEFDIYNRPNFRVTDFGVRKLTGSQPMQVTIFTQLKCSDSCFSV